jgi:hypothetical protein
VPSDGSPIARIDAAVYTAISLDSNGDGYV